MKGPIRVLIADDSVTMRAALSGVLQEDPRIQVVGTAADGVEAVAMAKSLRPDVITMDVLMPRLDGLGAIAAIMAEAPSRVLVVSSVVEDLELDMTFRTMAAGALELISKPDAQHPEGLRHWGRRVAESIRLMAEVPVITRRRPMPSQVTIPPLDVVGAVDAIALAASTGGPAALAVILKALPAGFPVPILIAEHIAEGFTAGLIRWFAGISPLTIVMARTGMPCEPEHVYLPPDSHDLEVEPRGLLRVTRSPGGHCPSADRLLASVARSYGKRAAGVVLTGMGEDGARGLLAMKKAGAVTIAQDQATSVVYGMPQAAAALGATNTILPLESIAPYLRAMCERPDVKPTRAAGGLSKT